LALAAGHRMAADKMNSGGQEAVSSFAYRLLGATDVGYANTRLQVRRDRGKHWPYPADRNAKNDALGGLAS